MQNNDNKNRIVIITNNVIISFSSEKMNNYTEVQPLSYIYIWIKNFFGNHIKFLTIFIVLQCCLGTY